MILLVSVIRIMLLIVNNMAAIIHGILLRRFVLKVGISLTQLNGRMSIGLMD